MTAPSLRSRWLVAFAVAAAIAAWPMACSQQSRPPDTADAPKAGPPIVGGAPTDPGDPAGKPADFTFKLKDMNGTEVDLASFKGRPLIVNFWATWCSPCKLEIPWFIEFKNQYRNQGLEVLGVSIDDPADELLKFAAEYKMNYPVLMGIDQDKMLEVYDAATVVPVTWFIRKDGTVQARSIGISSREFFEKMVKALF